MLKISTHKITVTQMSSRKTKSADKPKKSKKAGKEKPSTDVHDEGRFEHDTGDVYEGAFVAKKKDHVVKMHGEGAYTTAEGDIYKGHWDSDKLATNTDVDITYIDGSKYQGAMRDWAYFGKGHYQYPDGSTLEADFFDNIPIGELGLEDPNGHSWFGTASQGYAWLQPANHYYEKLEKTGKTYRKKNVDESAGGDAVNSEKKSLMKKTKLGNGDAQQ